MCLSRFRPTAPKTPLQYGPDGRALCRFCKQSVPPGRMTFCSSRCVDRWRLTTDGSYIRAKLFERDKGVCSFCSEDTEDTKRQLTKTPKDYFYYKKHPLWQAHHVKAVFEGGGLCGLEGYLTLCNACHAGVSAAQRERRDKGKRVARMVAILRFIEQESVTGATAAEIMDATNLSDTSVYKYLQRLRKWGYVAQSRKGAPFTTTAKGKIALNKVVKRPPGTATIACNLAYLESLEA